jgi:hypothetical protein
MAAGCCRRRGKMENSTLWEIYIQVCSREVQTEQFKALKPIFEAAVVFFNPRPMYIYLWLSIKKNHRRGAKSSEVLKILNISAVDYLGHTGNYPYANLTSFFCNDVRFNKAHEVFLKDCFSYSGTEISCTLIDPQRSYNIDCALGPLCYIRACSI